ncbi:MAG TPA: PEP/pyruvate-binding domain-containing protein [Tepidisphaeraceae bacterium]|nr:PEP/pyruvate-binding domain-containing protein [Tepidisphaeraceae bacterium]
MIHAQIYTQNLFDCRDKSLVGGKAANLGRLIRAGFTVPEGFVVNTRAFIFARNRTPADEIVELPPEVIQDIQLAYRAIGAGPVAVRSSATAEDMAAASMAGQYDTFLDINGEAELIDAVRRCWASIDAPRIRAYLNEHGIDGSRVAMAVVVQKLVPAEVAGVLFTANPRQGGSREMLIEASWGLGEALVSGKVQPDVLRLDQQTGRVIEATISDKRVQYTAGTHEEQSVNESQRRRSCLNSQDVHRLWQLGKRVAAHFGSPQDIEWAIQAGEIFLLQSRPITTFEQSEEYEQLLVHTREHLQSELSAGRGPWVLHNLAETLTHPTPLTWSVISRLMSGAGGFGEMYRQAGFEPSPAVMRDGFLERIGGKIYMDASRAPGMFFEDFPMAYDIEELKRRPDVSQIPPSVPRGSMRARWNISRKLRAADTKLRDLSKSLDRELRDNLFPEIQAYVARSKPIDLHTVTTDWLIELWREHEKMVLDTFAPQTLLPSLVSGMAIADLRTFLAEHFWDEDPDELSQLLSISDTPTRTMLADSELHEVGTGQRSMESWLASHGHRAAGEFDLASPRWRENPTGALEMAARLATAESPMERHRHTCARVQQRVESLRAKLNETDREELANRIAMARRYITFREDGKDFLMLGYDLLRDVALEAGRRLEIGQDVFFLTREELFDSLRVGYAPLHIIEKRKAIDKSEARLTLPRVIDCNSIDTLGEPSLMQANCDAHRAFAVSSGSASGQARVLHSPGEARELGKGYILVCPSTDPSWTPLFASAAGLVLECGGALSHGAVVAREMGLPAVVLPDATRLFRDGEQIHVDGHRGWAAKAQPAGAEVLKLDSIDPDNMSIEHKLLPPPVGSKERQAATIRNRLALLWTVYLAAFFTLPARWVYQPTLATIDLILWPVVRTLGKPATVAIVAVGIAAITLLIQKFFTDNPRLLEAKRRANALRKQAELLPAKSRRRDALLNAASTVQVRTLMAAMVPVGILLGPMILPFVWFKERVDPLAWNAAAGSAVQIVAKVDADWAQPMQLNLPEGTALDESTPASRTLPPIRKTLEQLLMLYRQPRNDSSEPWQLTIAPDLGRKQTADDLQAYLEEGIPVQGITWLVHPPQGMTGRFAVSVASPGQSPISMNIVLGDQYPPTPKIMTGSNGSPIKQVQVVYPKSKQEKIFFRPFAMLPGRLATLDIGWLWLYIIVYLPAVFLFRAFWKIA